LTYVFWFVGIFPIFEKLNYSSYYYYDEQMDFRTFLEAVSIIYPYDVEFTARKISEKLPQIMIASGHDKDLPVVTCLKAVSNYLSRLYHMGFLLRKKQKRAIRAGAGQTICRGYEFLYHFSKQGRDYVKYLRNPDTGRAPLFGSSADPVDMLETKLLYDHIPDVMKDHAQEVCRVFLSQMGTGRYKRFPRRTDPKLYLMLINVINENKILRMRLEVQKQKVKLLQT
jgi:hypothetical protein